MGIGKDSSGNGNYWTSNNISLTAGVTYDSMLDVPTLTSATNANYAVLNPLNNSGGATISDGNLKALWASTSDRSVLSTFPIPSTGKFYAEFTNGTLTAANVAVAFGLATEGSSRTGMAAANMWVYYASNQSYIVRSGTFSSQIGSNQTIAAGGIVQVAIDRANNQAWLGYNNVWINATNGTTGDPSAGTNPTVSSLPADLFIIVGLYADNGNVNFGQRPFSYTPPTGFNRLNTYNLPDSIVPVGAQYMAATTYTGTGAAQSITNTVNGKSLQPDFVWIKSRNNVGSNQLIDSVRGIPLFMFSDVTNGDTSRPNSFSSFNSSGFTVGSSSDGNTNLSTYTYVGWQWRASNASAVTNTNGALTSQVSVNQSAGFSIVTWTGTGTGGTTVGHGLSTLPQFVIIKKRNTTGDWYVASYASGQGLNYAYHLFLNTTGALSGSNDPYYMGTQASLTSNVLLLAAGNPNNGGNESGTTYVAYCWTPVPGYSAFGSYTGNGSANGPFVYLGFIPKYVLTKSSTGVESWYINDSSRDTYNPDVKILAANTSDVEFNNGSTWMDLTSNGFKIRYNGSPFNTSGGTYIYMAFAENPFKNALAR